uniref:Uncharacterized protein LOC114328460 n=1 Tax=Diabrotica virgifera virgifera TaxID=50390 RepID=A0A6P7FB47_DIAVI
MTRTKSANIKPAAEVPKRYLRSSCNQNNNNVTKAASNGVRKPAKRQLVKVLSLTPPVIKIPIKSITNDVQKKKTDPAVSIIPTDEQIPVTTKRVIAVVEEHKMDTTEPVVTAVEQRIQEAQEYKISSCNHNNNIVSKPTSNGVRKPLQQQLVEILSPTALTIPTKLIITGVQSPKTDPSDPIIQTGEQTPVTLEPILADLQEHKMNTLDAVVTAVEQRMPEAQDYDYSNGCQDFTTYHHKIFDRLRRNYLLSRNVVTAIEQQTPEAEENKTSSCNQNTNIATTRTSSSVTKPAQQHLAKVLLPTLLTIPTKPVITDVHRVNTDPSDPIISTDEQTPITTEPVIAVVEEHKMDTTDTSVTDFEQQTPEPPEYNYTNGCQNFTTYRYKKFDRLRRNYLLSRHVVTAVAKQTPEAEENKKSLFNQNNNIVTTPTSNGVSKPVQQQLVEVLSPILLTIPTKPIVTDVQRPKTDPSDTIDVQTPVRTEPAIAVVEEHEMNPTVPVVTAVTQQTPEAQEYHYSNVCQDFTTYGHKKFDRLRRNYLLSSNVVSHIHGGS